MQPHKPDEESKAKSRSRVVLMNSILHYDLYCLRLLIKLLKLQDVAHLLLGDLFYYFSI